MRISRIVLPFLLLAGCATARSPDLAHLLALREDPAEILADSLLRTGRLPNGLTYYVRRSDFPEGRAELRLVVRAGSVLEDADQRGLAHLLEHMAFNGTRRFGKNEIESYLERLGMRSGADLNAYTGYDETVYRLTVPTDTAGALETGLRVMEDWASSITVDPAELEREHGVVLEERRTRDGAGTRVHAREHAFLWAGSPYADRLVLDASVPPRADRAALERYYRDWYRPDLMAVVAVGDFDPVRVERLVREGFGGLAGPAQPRSRPEPAVSLDHGRRVLVTTDPELTQTVVELCWLRPAPRPPAVADHVDDYTTRLFLSMLNRRLEEVARQPGTPPFEFAAARLSAPVRPVLRLCVTATAREGGAEPALAGIVSEVERVARDGFTSHELERENHQRNGRTFRQSLAGVDAADAAEAYTNAYLSGGAPVLPHQQARLDMWAFAGVDHDSVTAGARAWLRAPERVVLLNAPEGAAGLSTEPRLAQVMDSAAAADLAPSLHGGTRVEELEVPDEGEGRTRFMPRLPEPGRIVARDSSPSLGVVRWTLSNGMRVVLRPQPDADRAHILATSPGGLSQVPDSLVLDGALSPAVVAFGGLGVLSAAELEQAMEGASLQVRSFVDEVDEGVYAVARPAWLEEALQLMHLHFVEPRLDTAAWNVGVRRVSGAVRGRGADPAEVFDDTMRAVMGVGDPRLSFMGPEVMDRVDPARALAVFRERFANAGDFTVYMVGRVDTARVRPLVERYLASLPSTPSRETAVDRGGRLPRGVTVRTVRAGRGGGHLAFAFVGEGRLSREQWADLDGAAEVLGHRLRARLRHELGLVYTQDVDALRTSGAVPGYFVAVDVPAAPERLEEVARVVLAEVDSLRAHGGSEDEVLRVREAALRDWTESRSEPEYWLRELQDAEENGWSPLLILLPPPSVTLTRERVRDAARAYLDPGRYVQVMLLPATDAAPAPPAPGTRAPRD